MGTKQKQKETGERQREPHQSVLNQNKTIKEHSTCIL